MGMINFIQLAVTALTGEIDVAETCKKYTENINNFELILLDKYREKNPLIDSHRILKLKKLNIEVKTYKYGHSQ